MNTDYDTIFGQFVTITQTDQFNIPVFPDKQKDLIHTAIRKFNIEMNDNLTWDDATEKVSRVLTDFEIMLLAHFLRLVFLENQQIYFTTLWRPFAKELGQTVYKSQVDSLKVLVDAEKNEINQLILSRTTDYDWEG